MDLLVARLTLLTRTTSLYLFIRYRSPPENGQLLTLEPDENTPLYRNDIEPTVTRNKTVVEIPSRRLISMVVIHAIVFVGLGIVMLVAPRIDANDHFDRAFWQSLALFACHFLTIFLSLISVIRVSIIQIKDAIRTGPQQPVGISLLSLTLQILVIVTLGILQAFRPHGNLDPSGAYLVRWWGWFSELGNVTVNYFILAVGHCIALLYLGLGRDALPNPVPDHCHRT